MQHPVILGNHVQIAAAPRHARELGENAVRIGNRVKDVPAYGEIERPIGGIELEDALVLE